MSYKRAWGAMLPIGESQLGVSNFNGNLNQWLKTEMETDEWTFNSSLSLAEPGTELATEFIEQGNAHLAKRPFGYPEIKFDLHPHFSGWNIRLPHWTVVLVLLLSGTLWQIFGKRPDDAVEMD